MAIKLLTSKIFSMIDFGSIKIFDSKIHININMDSYYSSTQIIIIFRRFKCKLFKTSMK